jgi:alanyl-tRNA synthetase|tara:strand:+ start:238 stop:2910 length:2673 start_codon:yes stop_codon:yes gene_type:complete
MVEKTLKNVRKAFLDYFSSRKHQIVESGHLVPNNDPTLMFTNSGMVQFKNVFTGLEKRPYKRAVTSQKCVRAGGKHNDLENVGYTPRHHTFFEMLGNFSFGDYFKDVAIELAWNLITKEFQISKEKLSVSVYAEDKEAFDLWKKIAGLPEGRIYKIATNDNFWSMGDLGPCGPCSEIFYDHGEHLRGGPPGSKDQDGDRFIEIWNLVFMQFEQVSKDKRTNLPKPSVDTGMGLERISALLQGTHDNYETDHFKTLIRASSNLTKTRVTKENISSHRVIADHLRASAFLIAEGVLPSNEGRGYVLRRIMRRGMRHSHTLGSKDAIFYKIVPTLIQEMSDSYPEIKRAESLITEILKTEEEKFSTLLAKGMQILNDNLSKVKNNSLPGEVAFKLYDTYGFPLDLTQDILKNKQIKVDIAGFDKTMNEMKEKTKLAWKGSGDKSVDKIWFILKDKIGSTEFLGYEKNKSEGIVLSLIKEEKEVDEINEGDEAELVTNQTPFYGESGGQIGDIGSISNNNSDFQVIDTQKKLGNIFVHQGKLVKGKIKVKDSVNLVIDNERRMNIRAYHSATHLLHEALRRILGKHVTQKGSFVGPDKLRFDFSHMKPIDENEIKKIEKYINDMVKSDSEIRTRLMTPKEAIDKGALALFGEKYGDEVRVLSMGKENNKYFSTELCGGTHVKNTSEIGEFKIVSQSAIASGVRRVEALRAEQLTNYLEKKKQDLDNLSKAVSYKIDSLEKEIIKLGDKPIVISDLPDNEKIKKLNKQLEQTNIKLILKDKNKNYIKDKTIKGLNVRYQLVKGFPSKELRSLIDQGKKELKKGIVIVYTIFDNKVGIAVGVTKNLTTKYNAVELVKLGSKVVGGIGGGGRNDFAQAGGSLTKNIEKSFQTIIEKI